MPVPPAVIERPETTLPESTVTLPVPELSASMPCENTPVVAVMKSLFVTLTALALVESA